MFLEGFLLSSSKSCICSPWVICLVNDVKDGRIMQFFIIGGSNIDEVVKLFQVIVVGKVALPKTVQVKLGIIKCLGKKFLILEMVYNHLDQDQ